MKKICDSFVVFSVISMATMTAQAAGTYYNTGGQQRTYSSYAEQRRAMTQNNNLGYTGANYANPNARYSVGSNVVAQQAKQVQVKNQPQVQSQGLLTKQGFYAGVGITHESAMWEFEMQQAGSQLHYDNIGWNVLDVNAGYKFDTKIPFQIDAGFRYGMQSAESKTIDDDITKGGFVDTDFGDGLYSVEHALSIGTSKDGRMLGFNVELGLTDAFKIGGLKITPAVGYRYLNYELQTKSNYGMAIDTVNEYNNCFVDDSGETQCNPLLVFFKIDGGEINGQVGQVEYIDIDGDNYADLAGVVIPASGSYNYISTENTYYYQQPGTSHDYDVTWAGPYVALNMEYDINQYNAANMRVELGFPGYKSEGNQPYRPDWQHPKSLEDETGMFGALHLGLAANWMTAITDSVSLSLGVTYDYYKVNKADATTYLNPSYYMPAYNSLLAQWVEFTGADVVAAEQYMLHGGFSDGDKTYGSEPMAVYINDLRKNGWKEKVSDEIKSLYRSLGVRLGVAVKF